MFASLLSAGEETKEDSKEYKFSSLRIWRMVTVQSPTSTKAKGFSAGKLTRNAFDLRPKDKSVSLSRLETEIDIKSDSQNNIKLMSCKISNIEKMQDIFISEEAANNSDLRLDPETSKLLNHIEFAETKDSKFSNDNVTGFHWDLFFISKDGEILSVGDEELSEPHILNAKDLLIEMSSIP